MKRLISALAVLGLAAFPAVAAARTIGTARASGDFAIALASGHTSHPHTIKVRVTSSPHQRVSVSWTMVCSKGFGAGSKSGDFAARTTVTRTLRMPYRHPDDCTVSASAQLARGGHVKVTLLGT